MKSPLVIIAIVGLAIAGLLAWALTRDVTPDPIPAAPSDTVAVTTTPPVPLATAPAEPLVIPPPIATATTTATAATATQAPFVPPAAQPPAIATTTAPKPTADIPRVTAEQLHSRVERGDVVVVDVRPADAFARNHIVGAVNITPGDMEKRFAELPRNKGIVLYCT